MFPSYTCKMLSSHIRRVIAKKKKRSVELVNITILGVMFTYAPIWLELTYKIGSEYKHSKLKPGLCTSIQTCICTQVTIRFCAKTQRSHLRAVTNFRSPPHYSSILVHMLYIFMCNMLYIKSGVLSTSGKKHRPNV